MHVLFIEPSFPNNQREFVRALHSIGCRVTGIGERPYDWLDGELRYWLVAYERVRSVTDEQAVIEAVRRVQGRGWVDRLEATVEAHILPIARVREACTIPGLPARTAYLCRDKVAMKDVLRRAGVPCAASAAISSLHEAREFATRVGFPVIISRATRLAPRAPTEPATGRRSRMSFVPLTSLTVPALRWRSSSRDTRASTTRSPSRVA